MVFRTDEAVLKWSSRVLSRGYILFSGGTSETQGEKGRRREGNGSDFLLSFDKHPLALGRCFIKIRIDDLRFAIIQRSRSRIARRSFIYQRPVQVP